MGVARGVTKGVMRGVARGVAKGVARGVGVIAIKSSGTAMVIAIPKLMVGVGLTPPPKLMVFETVSAVLDNSVVGFMGTPEVAQRGVVGRRKTGSCLGRHLVCSVWLLTLSTALSSTCSFSTVTEQK